MNKYMDKLYKGASWIIMGALLVGYFAYMTLKPNGSLQQTASDWRSWLHILFVVFMNVTMVGSAYDTGTSVGTSTDEYKLSDELNNKIITSVNNEMEDFRIYTKKLNDHELQNIREDYLFSIGDKKLEDMTKKELKMYKKLKPIQHNIYGFNLPLFYEISKNGKVSYQSSVRKNQGKNSQKIKKAFIGIMFGGMTINVSFAMDGVGDALISLLVISLGLITTFLMIYFPQVFKFKFELPQKVILKKTFYDSYVNFKNGTHKLKELTIKEQNHVEETLVEDIADNTADIKPIDTKFDIKPEPNI